MIPYVVSFDAVAVTAQQDLLDVLSATTTVCELLGVSLSQHTETGDAAEEELLLYLKRGVGSTVGSGGSAQTPIKLETGAAAAAFSARKNDTTIMTGGTITILHTEAWNVRSAFYFEPPPERRIFLSPAERLTLHLASTPADSITMNCAMYIGQYGG